LVIRITGWVAAGLAVLLLALVAWSLWLSRPLFDERLDPATLASLAIAPPEQALTFARYRQDDGLRVLLVTRYENGRLTGFDLQQVLGTADKDPLSLYARVGHEALERLAATGRNPITVQVAALVLPFDPPAAHIGIGTNYVEHAREAQVEEQPFVFPKRVQPTLFNAAVPRGGARRLDYEAELGFVALEDIAAGARPRTLGLVLANDFTDRWSLVRNLDFDGEMGTTGFVEGKSREGFAPIGNLLVIPQDLETFYRGIELNLYVNGRLRQRERAGAMVWGPAQMLDESFRRADWTFRRYDGTVPLLPHPGVIPRGTIVFSGTPAGVIFKPLNLWNPWAYLQPGDEVVMRSDRLGVLANRIVE
jgi:2,4-didehydro-3-deoxy-L-rhamnonate hydrolase